MAFSGRITQLQDQKQKMKFAYNMHLSDVHKKAKEQQDAVEEITEKQKDEIEVHMEKTKSSAKSKFKSKIDELDVTLKAKLDEIKAAVADKKHELAQEKALERAEWAAERAEISFAYAIDSIMEADIAYYEAIKAQLEAEEILQS